MLVFQHIFYIPSQRTNFTSQIKMSKHSEKKPYKSYSDHFQIRIKFDLDQIFFLNKELQLKWTKRKGKKPKSQELFNNIIELTKIFKFRA